MLKICKQMGELRREDLRRREDRRETADAVGQETAKLPFAEESARGTADGNADGRRCFSAGAPKDLQKLYELLRRWRRKMSAGTCHELRKFARDSQVCCASFRGGRSLRKQQGPSGGGSQSELQVDCGDVSRVLRSGVTATDLQRSGVTATGIAAQWRDGHGTAVQWRVRHGRVVSWRDDHGIGTPVRLYTTEANASTVRTREPVASALRTPEMMPDELRTIEVTKEATKVLCKRRRAPTSELMYW